MNKKMNKRAKNLAKNLAIKVLDEATLSAATGGKMTYEWCQKAAAFEFWVAYAANDCGRFE